MRKIAFFVEGQTEMLFLEALLRHLAAEGHLCIEKLRAQGGGKNGKPRLLRAWARSADAPEGECNLYAQIVDCGGDSKVLSDLRDNYRSLLRGGFDWMVGLRDVYPDVPRAEYPRLRQTMDALLPRGPADASIVLAVMEVEAWFLAEYTHFERLDPRLHPQAIAKRLGLDVRNIPASDRPHPAEDLRQIYELASISYNKSRNAVLRTLEAMDFRRLAVELPPHDPELRCLVGTVRDFLQLKAAR